MASVLFLGAVLGGCAVSMRQSLPGLAVDPDTVITRMERLIRTLDTNKQIFRVRLLDKGRTFSGDGALVYRAPDTMQMSIYGPPFSTLWMQLLTRGDSITVVLPKENRVIRSVRGDPQNVNNLADSQGLTDGEFLGGVTGIYRLERFLDPEMETSATEEGNLLHLRLRGEKTTYEFVYDWSLDAVVRFVRYEQGKVSRELVRSQFHLIDGVQRASKVIYRDYLRDREITVLVSKERVNPTLEDSAFDILIP